MATTQDSAPQSLSLPASHFAKLSPSSFLAAHLPGSRPSSRSPTTARTPTLHTGSLTHAHGSAVVRVGDTAVVCGVRGETLKARDTNLFSAEYDETSRKKDADVIAELGLLVPNIELATGCNPQYMPGNPPTTQAQSLTQRVLTLLRIADLVSLDDLTIWEDEGAAKGEGGEGDDGSEAGVTTKAVKAYWTLYIDILVISLDGSPFDACWGAVMAALGDLRLPRAWWDVDRENVLCDPRPSEAKKLTLRGCPVALSFAAFSPPEGVGSKKTKDGVYVLTDPDDFEEGCCSQIITVVVEDGGNEILRLEMGGGTLLDMGDVNALVERTGERWKEWKGILNTAKGT